MLCLLLVGCAKDQVTEEEVPVFVEKEYFAQSQETIMDEVTAFLKYTDTYAAAISRKDDFPDTDPNEGMWLLEGGSNYFADYEMEPTDDVEIKEYTLVIENTVENGAIKMKGHDMTTKFDGFQNQLAADIEGTPDLVDFRITSVDAEQSTLDVKVIKKKPKDINAAPGCYNSAEYKELVFSELEYSLPESSDFDPTPPSGGVYSETYVNVLYLIGPHPDAIDQAIFYHNAPSPLPHNQYFFKGSTNGEGIQTWGYELLGK